MAADVTVDAGDEVCACTYPHVPERLQVQLHYFDSPPFLRDRQFEVDQAIRVITETLGAAW